MENEIIIDDKYNEVFEHAKQMEVDGKSLYEEELAKTENAGLRKILEMLIKAEQNHYEIFCALQLKHKVPVIQTSIADIKTIFSEMKENGEEIVTSDEHSDFYEKVKEIEIKAEEYFRNNAEKAAAEGNEKLSQIFTDLANEEHRHVILMTSLLEMTRNPQQWVEDAEWNHMDEY